MTTRNLIKKLFMLQTMTQQIFIKCCKKPLHAFILLNKLFLLKRRKPHAFGAISSTLFLIPFTACTYYLNLKSTFLHMPSSYK